jgi:photosystem II stability/assembly factor-like uncharacterized protein
MVMNKKGDLFAGTYTSSVFRTTDSGNTWLRKSTGIPVKNSNWIMSLEINSQNHVFAAVLGGGVYRSLDDGDHWHPVNNRLETGRYNALVIDSKDVLYAANEDGNVFRSTDNGEIWHKLETMNPISDHAAELEVDDKNQLYFGAAEKGIFRYSDKDRAWIPLNKGLTMTGIRSLLFVKDSLFIAGTSGTKDYENFTGEDLYISTDEGKNWSLINSGLNHPRIKALAINSKGTIFAGTWGGGVYKSSAPLIKR